MEHGEDQWMIDTYIERGLPIPEWAVLRPEVPVYLLWVWDSFWELDTCRYHDGGSPKSIPWTAIKDYAVFHRIDFSYFHRIVRALDSTYITFMNNQLKKASEKKTSPSQKQSNKTRRR